MSFRPETMDKVIARLVSIVEDPNSSRRSVSSAARVLAQYRRGTQAVEAERRAMLDHQDVLGRLEALERTMKPDPQLTAEPTIADLFGPPAGGQVNPTPGRASRPAARRAARWRQDAPGRHDGGQAEPGQDGPSDSAGMEPRKPPRWP